MKKQDATEERMRVWSYVNLRKGNKDFEKSVKFLSEKEGVRVWML
jgi:hypothetical protein